MSDDDRDVTPDLAYTTARTMINEDGEDDLRLGALRLRQIDDESWQVLRQERGVDAIGTEADIVCPGRFRSIQTLAAYLLGIAWTDEDEWPRYVPEDPS